MKSETVQVGRGHGGVEEGLVLSDVSVCADVTMLVVRVVDGLLVAIVL